MDSKRNPKNHILAIIVCFSVAAPIVCLPHRLSVEVRGE